MSWATSKEAVRIAIATALRLLDYTGGDGKIVHRVEWEHKKKSVRYLDNGSAWANLRMGTQRRVGTDETRYTAVNGGDDASSKWVPVYGGRRQFVVTVMMGSDSQEDSADAVGELAGRLVTRLGREDILQTLYDSGVGLETIGVALNADYVDSTKRWVSASFVDLTFSAVESDTDGVDGSGDYVARADGTGELERPDETLVDAEFDTDDMLP